MALRPRISLVLEGYVVMTIKLNTSKAWNYKMYGHYLLQVNTLSHKVCVVSITLPGCAGAGTSSWQFL